MAHNYLLEIGLEEIPAHVVTPSINQLSEKIAKFLDENRLSYDKLERFSTPRRLAVLINNLSDKQDDVEEDAKGPAKKIALDADGNWTKAAIGFAKGQGVNVEDITFKEIKGTEYVFVHKLVKGKSAQEILSQMPEVIKSMNFPTMMKWADYDFKFVRPIRWMVSLLDSEVLPFEILDVKADRISKGHRFLGQDVQIDNATEYAEKLEDQFVIVDADKRKELISQQIKAIADSNNWKVIPDANLLEEVNNLVEWPTAFSGKFDEKYLDIPDEVLITSMKDHQRFFYVKDNDGKLLPDFISVRNGNKEHLDNVISGNEKVLTARLEDAAFFYNEDQKHPISFYVDKLKSVSFHDKIGTMYEKMCRVNTIASVLSNTLNLDSEIKNNLDRASQIYKFDLVTGMVGEFSELQGVMGEKYALLQGENKEVAQAIREHYLPNSSDGELPNSLTGAVLALADKFDNIWSFFGAGMIPTGSNDPYALRRHAYGIVRILNAQKWNVNLLDLMSTVSKALKENDTAFGVDLDQNQKEVVDFINDRIKLFLEHQKIAYDVIDTVLLSNSYDAEYMIDAANVLQTAHANDGFKDIIETLTRVQRISVKNELKDNYQVDEKLFENDSEKQLYAALQEIEGNHLENNAKKLFDQLCEITDVIKNYFDQTMVMDKNQAVQQNRLNTLTRLSNVMFKIGDLTKIIVK